MTWTEFPCIYCKGPTQAALRHPDWRFCPSCEPKAAKRNADEIRLNFLTSFDPNSHPRTGYEGAPPAVRLGPASTEPPMAWDELARAYLRDTDTDMEGR